MPRRVSIGLLLATTATILVAVLKSENLPFNDYMYESGTLTAVFGLLNLPVFFVLLMTRIDFAPFALFLVFLQWFVYGVLAHWIFYKIRNRRVD